MREVGLVEPPAVIPVPKQPGEYFVLDGHLRIEALKDLGQTHVTCMVATTDDTYSFNKRINRLSAVQDHKMIVQAMDLGVSAMRLGSSLSLAPATILERFRLLNGICPDAIDLLADTNCPARVFDILRQMKPIRQIEAAELMIGNKNLSGTFANALLAATPPNQLVAEKVPAVEGTVSVESLARVERELASLQLQTSAVEDTYGPDVLHLTVIRGYIGTLLANATVVRWLAKHQPEYLKEFQSIADMSELPSQTTPALADSTRG